jgi:hypothetical protein
MIACKTKPDTYVNIFEALTKKRTDETGKLVAKRKNKGSLDGHTAEDQGAATKHGSAASKTHKQGVLLTPPAG